MSGDLTLIGSVLFDAHALTSQTTERRLVKSISPVWSLAELLKFTQIFRPLSPKFYRGLKCSKFGLDF